MSASPAQVAAFIDEWASKGADVARKNSLPVSAMLACACTESGFGMGAIFKKTKNPFNLQKWPHIPYPRAGTNQPSDTVVETKTGRQKIAPFNYATDVPDAVRQWCEWILHYGEADGPPQDENPHVPMVIHPGNQAARDQLLKYRRDPVNFAFNLPLVGFGEGKTKEQRDASGAIFKSVLITNKLTRFD